MPRCRLTIARTMVWVVFAAVASSAASRPSVLAIGLIFPLAGYLAWEMSRDPGTR